jgi:hypothetical protein
MSGSTASGRYGIAVTDNGMTSDQDRPWLSAQKLRHGCVVRRANAPLDVRPDTKLVHTEVVANPDLRVADVAALATIAHEARALLTIESTVTPPP